MSRWHAREHRKALDGMLVLTLEEKGAYTVCLDLMYEREGPIPDDGRWLAGWMGVSARKWSAIRAALIVKGKLFEVNYNGVPSLMNKRAASEIENQSERSRKLAENGAKGGTKSSENRVKDSKNNDPAQATAAAGPQLIDSTDTSTETEEKTPPAKPSGLSGPRSKRAKTRLCPPDWLPSGDDLAVGAEEGFSPGEIERELAKFRDYEFRDPHSDWSRAFRFWLRRSAERKSRQAHDRHAPSLAKHEATIDNYERAFFGSERSAGRVGEP